MNSTHQTLRPTFEKYFGASSEEVESILQHLRTVELDGGEWLFRQGDEGDSLYFVIRGRLEIWVTAADPGAKPALLGEITPGRSVGEISLLTGARRTASVRAIRNSQLFVVSRAEFESLARIHPALAMKLAGRVAAVLRDRTSRPTPAGRTFRTIAIVPLGDGERVQSFARQFAVLLSRHGRTLSLSDDDLGTHGAPLPRLEAGDAVPATLREWLHDQENLHRFLIYRCAPDTTPWSVYAMQQSDVVLFVADATADPRPSDGEATLDAASASSNARRMMVLLQPDSAAGIRGTREWLGPRRIDLHLHVRADVGDELARVARVIAGRALGLVLAAGAARGFAHLGVYKAMSEAGVRPDWVGGTSVGAIMAAVIAKGWSAEDCIARVHNAFARSNPFGDFTIPLMSLLRGRRLEWLLRDNLSGDIEDLPIPFFGVSCNLDSGALNLHESGDLPAALRASASMPGVMPPAVVERQLAIDGSVLNSMPVDIMRTKPVGLVVAVDLASQKTYELAFTSMPSPWAVLRGRLLPFARRYRVPTLMTLLLKATEVGTLARVREQGSRADLLLNPPVREFGMMDIGSFDRIVDAGYQYARTALADWQAARKSDRSAS